MLLSQIHKIILTALQGIAQEVNLVKNELRMNSETFMTYLVGLFRKHNLISFYEHEYSMRWRVNTKNKEEFINVFRNYALPNQDN